MRTARAVARAATHAALGLLAAGCDTSQVTEPIATGIVWTRVTGAASVNLPFFPDWRADSIAFQHFDANGRSRLAVMHESGMGVRFLPGGVFITDDRHPRWVSDSILIFTSNRTGSSFDLWYRSLATGQVRPLTAFAGGEWDPSPRPGLPGVAYVEAASNPLQGRVVLIPDTAAAPLATIYLTPADLKTGEVAWNSAGDRLCFSADSADGSRHIWVASLAPGDTALTQLTTGPFHDFNPRFSPDGARILFTSDRTGRSGVWWVHPSGEGSGLDVIAFEDQGALIATTGWSPDGSRIVLSSDGRGFGRALWILSNLPF